MDLKLLKNKILKKLKGKQLEEFKQDELKDDFFDLFMKIGFAKTNQKKQDLIKKASKIADKIPEFKGWPKAEKIWDIEAFGWTGQIPKKVRNTIKQELRKRISPGSLNLALGSGAYPYLEESVLLDYSEEMLRAAVKYKKKVLYDINKGKLPFKKNEFDSITMVFVINYLDNPKQVFKETKRILKTNGKLIIIQSAKSLNYLSKIVEKKQ